MEEKELRRLELKEKARQRRRRRRKRIVMIERILVAAFGLAVLIVAGVLIYILTPGIKVARQLEKANACMEAENYDEAIASCEEVLKIDSSSVQAYRAMAGAYLTKEDTASAEQILYKGWETTKDESLLQYYCTVLLNESVADINSQNCSFYTLNRCLSVLEKDSDNANAYELLNVCYDRIFGKEAQKEGFLCDTEGGCSFASYQETMLQMLLLYEKSPSEKLKTEILKFAIPGEEEIRLEIAHLSDYLELLKRIANAGESKELQDITACTEKAIAMQDFFGSAFRIFESEDFTPIKDFMVGEEYLAIRDAFMNKTMEYWDGETYIPISRTKMKFLKKDGEWKFAFDDYKECQNRESVINIWSAKQEDAGVQRISISYEPASENGEYLPHTTYEFTYLYSNVKVGKDKYVPQMNYRFETLTETEEETTAQLIGDWGGDHEWTADF